MTITKKKQGFTVKAYQGDAKTLLAFNLESAKTKNLAGFTIGYFKAGQGPFYLANQLRFKDPSKHLQDPTQLPTSTVNAPIHRFRWIHVPGSLFQSDSVYFGKYNYVVTPRYFDATGSLQAIDPKLTLTVPIEVGPFKQGPVRLGFARGFTQSQAFVNHFGPKALTRPKELLFDTSAVAGKNSRGETYTYANQYAWLGFTARTHIFDAINEVIKNPALSLDLCAYDLNEPDLLKLLLQLAAKGRKIRILLDNATLHHTAAGTEPEDQFEQQFLLAAKKTAAIKRGKFGRFAHNKQFIISDAKGPRKVLTGSTNFSVTGMYVNSNHVVVFDDRAVASVYARVFETAWQNSAQGTSFSASPDAQSAIAMTSPKLPPTEIAYSPHTKAVATQVLTSIADRITQERAVPNGSVLFAVMDLGSGSGPIFPALQALHADERIFSYGISDTTDGIALYKPGTATGLLVTGKPAKSVLPPPFNQIPALGAGHQVHHKFVVCSFNTANAVVYCGSSNLALGGEQENGDNLIAIHDSAIATVFAIEALGLVDHFQFLDKAAVESKANNKVAANVTTPQAVTASASASKQQLAAEAGWFLSTSDKWVAPYYNTKDLHCVDRLLFG